MPAPAKNALQELRVSSDARVKVAVVDVDGVLRGKFMDKEKFLSAAEGGFGFCNVVFGWDAGDVCYDNAQYTGWHTGYPDATARIDASTMRRVPWDANVPFFLGDFDSDVCPRTLLRRTIERAKGIGYAATFGMEFEWFNFRETPQSFAA